MSIAVEGLTKRFGSVRAVEDLTFATTPGRVTGFLGPNGAGKTTTLRMVLGLVIPTAGRALIDGQRYVDLAHPLREVGAALEASSFHPGRSARDHLRVLAGKGYDLRLASDDVPQTLLLALVGVGVWTVFGLGLGTLISNQVAAILIALGVTLVLDPLIAFGLGAADLGSAASYLPSSASQAVVQGVSTVQDVNLLPWWGGLLVLLGYGGLFAAVGAYFARKRDIT